MKYATMGKPLFDISELISDPATKKVSGFITDGVQQEPSRFFRGGSIEALAESLPLPLLPEAFYTYVSRGDWSQWELLEHILSWAAPCSLVFSTWSISELSARKLAEWIENGKVTNIAALIDHRSTNRHPAAYHLASHHIAKLKVASCHAKVAVLYSEATGYITIIGSANMTENPRIECGTIFTHKAIGEQHTAWIMETIQLGAYEL